MPNIRNSRTHPENGKGEYAVKTWLFTILIAPLLIMIIETIKSSSSFMGVKDFGIAAIFIGFAYSLPAFALYYVAFWGVDLLKIGSTLKKSILCFIALTELVLTFYILVHKNPFSDTSFIEIILPYAIAIVIFSFIFRFK